MRSSRSLVLLSIMLVVSGIAFSGDILFREDFASLDQWKEVFFPKIPEHTRYTVENDGKQTYLRAESHASASLLIYRDAFNPYEYPHVSWLWKVDTILPKADLLTKSGDDVPIRIYIAFAYDPKQAGFFESIQYNAARLIYGEYPPHSSLNYIWSSRMYDQDIITSAYTGRSKMILLEKGDKNVGIWVKEEVNILSDYRRAFGEDPPAKATIGVMNDSDNTKGEAVSYITSLMVYR